MPVPDEVIFGIDNETYKEITYGDVRKISDEDKLILLLKQRLTGLLINQVQPITGAFPKATMTCILIETLGTIFYGKGDTQSYGFNQVCKQIHQNFSTNSGKKFKEALGNLWDGTEDVNKIKTLSDLIYKFFRNSMVHGYHGRGVYLSNKETTFIKKDSEGFLILNPEWFWGRANDVYQHLFYEAINGQFNNPRRKQLLEYIYSILN